MATIPALGIVPGTREGTPTPRCSPRIKAFRPPHWVSQPVRAHWKDGLPKRLALKASRLLSLRPTRLQKTKTWLSQGARACSRGSGQRKQQEAGVSRALPRRRLSANFKSSFLRARPPCSRHSGGRDPPRLQGNWKTLLPHSPSSPPSPQSLPARSVDTHLAPQLVAAATEGGAGLWTMWLYYPMGFPFASPLGLWQTRKQFLRGTGAPLPLQLYTQAQHTESR